MKNKEILLQKMRCLVMSNRQVYNVYARTWYTCTMNLGRFSEYSRWAVHFLLKSTNILALL